MMDNIAFDLASLDPPAIVIPAANPPEHRWRLEEPKDNSVRDREIAFQVLNAIDAAETLYCVHGIPERCHEANPLYGKKPSVMKILAFKTADGLGHYLVTKTLEKHKPGWVKPWQVTTIVLYGGLVTWNATVIF